ncbi:MAG: hypothetical protein IPN32_21155 [Deltaproteobacteria bacterium]|nr:hypothetical protein [Deltaproteobacteria bacterium]
MLDRVEVVQHHQIERAQLLLEQLLGGEGDQRERLAVLARDVVEVAQDVVAQQLDVGVAAQQGPQRADVPVGATGHVQHTDLVAQHLHHERAAVVRDRGLAGQLGHEDLVDELPHTIGRDLEFDPLRHAVPGQRQAALADGLAVATQRHRGPLTAQAVRDDGGLERGDVLDERELARADLGDRDVAQRRRADADRGDGHAQARADLLQLRAGGVVVGADQPVAQHHHRRQALARPRSVVAEAGQRGREIGRGTVGRHRQRLGRLAAKHLELVGERADVEAQALVAPARARVGGRRPGRAQPLDAGGRGAALGRVGDCHRGRAIDQHDHTATRGRHAIEAQRQLEGDREQGQHRQQPQQQHRDRGAPRHRAATPRERQRRLDQRDRGAQPQQQQRRPRRHVARREAPGLAHRHLRARSSVSTWARSAL